MKPIIRFRSTPSKPATRLPRYWRIILFAVLGAALLTGCGQAETPAYTPAGNADLDAMAAEYPMQYEQWAESVHGQASLAGDANAPDCLDCHADPASGEIQTAAFQLDIPKRCARCHADEDMMAQYGVSADVVET